MVKRTGGSEAPSERLDRELIELLNEIRVLLPGVQVLFAFLLAVPFASGFARVSDVQRDAYTVSLLCALVATMLLVAPTTYHRLRFRQRDKEALVRTSNKLTIAGSVFLAASMTAAVVVVIDTLFSTWFAGLVAGLSGLGFLLLWYGLPLSRKVEDGEDDDAETGP